MELPWVGKDPLEEEMTLINIPPWKFHGRKACQAIVNGVTKNQAQLSNLVCTQMPKIS